MKLLKIETDKRTVRANMDDPTEPGYGNDKDRDLLCIWLWFGEPDKPEGHKWFGVFLQADTATPEKVAEALQEAAQKLRDGPHAKPRP